MNHENPIINKHVSIAALEKLTITNKKSIKRSKRVFSIKGHYKKYNKKKKSNYSIYKEDMSYLFDFYYDKTNNKIKNKMIKILKNDKSSIEKIKKKEYQILSPISILMLALYIDDFN